MVDLPRDWDGLPIQLEDEAIEHKQAKSGSLRALLGRFSVRFSGQKDGVYFSGYIFNEKGKPVPYYRDEQGSVESLED